MFDRADKPSFVRNQNPTASAVQATRTAMIRTLYTVDDQVDRLMRHLQSTGELTTTLDGRDILSGYARPQALIECWHDPNNNRNIPGWASIRGMAWQYMEYYDIANPAAVTFREYYNLQADPYQLVNLLADGNPPTTPTPRRCPSA